VTFSICVREAYENRDNDEHTLFGVGITTRVASVGMQSPYASENGAVSAQSGGIGPAFEIPNVKLREKAIEYVDDGMAIGDAVQGLLNVDEGMSVRQVHGVDDSGTFTHTGEDCGDWAGHTSGENYTVAGNLLAGPSVIDETASAYVNADESEPLGKRLIDALAAGHDAGGDKREELHIHSGAILIKSTEYHAPLPYYNNIRVDATENPISDLQETYRMAREGYEMLGEDYEDPI